MSRVSSSTQDGVKFDLLCRGDIKNYSFNPVDLTGERDVKQIEQKLIKRLEDTVRELELQSERRIAKYYIGKTYVRQMSKGRRRYKNFKCTDPRTWKKDGIISRWGDHRKKDYGRDGLVVLGLLTRQSLPRECTKRIDQEDLALAMEQKLLHQFLLSKPDSRLVNETFTAGKLDGGKSIAYAVYMAFSYEDSSTSNTEEGGTSAQQEVHPSHSQSSNIDQESHQSACNITPATPHSTTSSGTSSDCIITACCSGTQSDPLEQRVTLEDGGTSPVEHRVTFDEGGTSPQQEVHSTHSQSSNIDQESHQSACTISPASPHSTTSSGASSDCIIIAQFSGIQTDPRSRRRPTNTATSTHQPHPHQQVANTPSHTSPRPHPPPTLSPPPPKRKNIDPIMEKFLNSLTANPLT